MFFEIVAKQQQISTNNKLTTKTVITNRVRSNESILALNITYEMHKRRVCMYAWFTLHMSVKQAIL